MSKNIAAFTTVFTTRLACYLNPSYSTCISVLYNIETSQQILFSGLNISILSEKIKIVYITKQGITAHGLAKSKYKTYRGPKLQNTANIWCWVSNTEGVGVASW